MPKCYAMKQKVETIFVTFKINKYICAENKARYKPV